MPAQGAPAGTRDTALHATAATDCAFDGPRFSARSLGVHDRALVVALYADARVMTHIAAPMDHEAAGAYFDRLLRHTQRPPATARAHFWALTHSRTGEALGIVSLVRDAEGSRSGEIGVMLLPHAHASGVAVHALEGLIEHLVLDRWGFGLDRLWGRHHPENRAAERVARHVGMVPTGRLRDGQAECVLANAVWAAHGVHPPLPPLKNALNMSDSSDAAPRGSLSCVGLGMMLGAHLGPRARSEIETADVVFGLVSNAIVELWLQQMRPDMRSLQPYYREGKPRTQTYREMVEAMLVEVRAGKRVCGVFYGHPGVFALVPHRAIAGARAEGFDAVMEPGVSAEDCLYADLGVDPGTYGCQHFEASQMLFYRRVIDPSAYLVIWQIGVVGDRSFARFHTGAAYRQLLVERLIEAGYPADHPVTIYEAATLPIAEPRMDVVPLSALVEAELSLHSTLAVPPARAMEKDAAMLARIALIDAAVTVPNPEPAAT